MRYNGKSDCLKVICISEKKAKDIVENDITFIFRLYRAKFFVKPIKMVICYKCAKFNHLARECKSKQVKCFRCSESHIAYDCPLVNKENEERLAKESIKDYKCSNCNGEHPATYGRCHVN
jgi:hypothetical protein